ncbi:MAG: hypothetical protein WBP61_03215 [Nocardioides sp.]
MRASLVAGAVLTSLAIAICLFLGTVGWFFVGFAMMTDCTTDYSELGNDTCTTTGRWINAGALLQWVLAATGAALLVWGLVAKRSAHLVIGGVALAAVSVVTIVATTWAADRSYCQPGTPGYARSYCSTGP